MKLRNIRLSWACLAWEFSGGGGVNWLFPALIGGEGERGSSIAICQVFGTPARTNRHGGLAVQHLGVASARGFCSCVATAASTGNVLILSSFSSLVSLILPSFVPNFISPSKGGVWTFEQTKHFFVWLLFYPFFSIFADSAEMPDGRVVDFASLRIFIIPWTNSSRGFCRREGSGGEG